MPSITLEVDELNDSWLKYGLQTGRVVQVAMNGERVPLNRQVIAHKGKFLAFVSDEYALIPNEEVIGMVEKAGFNPKETSYSRNGNKVFIEVQTPLSKEVRVGDIVKLGAMVRNSVDGSMGLGVDAMTMRLVCSNGAVARGEDLGSFAAKHVGDTQSLTNRLKQAITSVVQKSERLIHLYRKAAEIQVNQQFAQALVNNYIPQKYLPEYITVEEGQAQLSRTPDLWTTFNDLTQNVWHSDRVAMDTKVTYERIIHQQLEQTVLATTS